MTSAPIIKQAPRKRLAVFLDGTWNSVLDNTNVWRMKSLCSSQSADQFEQRSYYDVGVNGFWGGAFGKGLDENIIDAYEWLVSNYNLGDEIFIFGFSRGAYTARSLSGLIAICGLLKAGGALSVKQLFERYKHGLEKRTVYKLVELNSQGKTSDFDIEERWMVKYCHLAHIKCVCVWDTVGYLGLPFGGIKGVSRETFSYLHTGLRVPIENGYQALAIDEHRLAFLPTLWTVKKLLGRPIASVEQRWFVGAHGNVGGGYPSDPLAQVPLRWMMKKASAHGLTFRSDVDLDGSVETSPIADSYKDFLYGLYRLIRKPIARTIDGEPSETDGTPDHPVNETIDASVFQRYRTNASYRPKTLTDWATKRHVDPSSITASVRADEPNTTVSD